MAYCGIVPRLGRPVLQRIARLAGSFPHGFRYFSQRLFGSLQVVTAGHLGLSPVVMAAEHSSGGVMGKMISLQTIAVAAAATGMSVDDQARFFRLL